MNHGLMDSMFWVGGLMVAAPLVFFGTVIGIWWYLRRKERADEHRSGEGRP